jgi:peptidoglycan-N-acetylglucosamine deacetylase
MTTRELSAASMQACVTISVDDGSSSDFRTADLLDKYGLQATFYIPGSNPERPVLEPSQIRALAARFEIGSHTLHHTPLKSISDYEASREIQNGKSCLEDMLGSTVISFCYPRGKFNRSTPSLVKAAGFLGARTQLLNLHELPKNPFLWGVSTHAWSHSKTIQVRHALLEGNFVGMFNFFREYKATTDWQRHFTRVLERVTKHGGLAHLALHSWEIEELGEWHKLESMFDLISRCGLPTATNGELYRAWYRRCETGDAMATARYSA